jgi:hypothetical protein
VSFEAMMTQSSLASGARAVVLNSHPRTRPYAREAPRDEQTMTTYRMTIRNAPPGILMTRSGLTVFKTEYQDQDSSGTYRPICYVVISGERYHGDGYDVDCIEVTQDAIDAAHEHWKAPDAETPKVSGCQDNCC